VDEAFSTRRIAYALTAAMAVIAAGTVAFHHFSHEGSLTGLDTVPSNDSTRLISIALVLAGVTIFAFIATILVEGIASGVFTGAMAERRRKRAIDRLENHYIICGYGRVGRRVGEEFREAGVKFVVLDFSADAIEHAREKRVLFIEGNGTDDEDLAAAGLRRARGLVASSDSDVDNLYITLSARAAHPNLLIVARASDEDVAAKLYRAGASRVVQPYSTAGKEMAALVLRPQVSAFLEAVTGTGGGDLQYEEIVVTDACDNAGRTIRQLRIRHETGAVIVALRKGDGTFDSTPDPDAVLEVGDVMIAAGSADELRLLEELFAPREAVAG
jgi:voltage-gated potassium channel